MVELKSLSRERLLAVGLLLFAIALIYMLVFSPLLTLRKEYSESVDELEFRLERYRKIAAERPLWSRRVEEIKQHGRVSEQYIAKETPALASADLQTLIKEIVTTSGGELISTQVVPEQQEEQLTRIAVRIRMNGSTRVLRDVLHAVETSQPILWVDNLNLRPIRMPMRPGSKAAPDRLSIDFEVVGYMRAG
ncbi:type II secretion system protein GspM [Methylotetracoccus oryzae]|uniref:type II secretion system protein GspM n=1 Tax=Methylotetracoccus oryzae TaxID=1919059 RepID=UPI001F235D3A|nr:type II secretion system protein GspM [Methylotetracoccus oryzae]